MDINQPKQQLDTLIYHAFRYKLDQDDSTISELFLTFPNLIINAQTHVEDETLLVFSLLFIQKRVLKPRLERPDLNLYIPEYSDQSFL